MRLVVITAPAAEPLSLADAKAELKIDFTDDDTLITAKIKEARAWAETYTRRALITRIVEYGLDEFPDGSSPLILPLGKATKIEHIKYRDENGVLQTLTGPTSTTPGTDYTEDLTDDRGAVIEPIYEDFWPATRKMLNAVIIRFSAGYGPAATDIPPDILTGVRARLSDIYEVRGAVDTPRRGRDWYEVAQALLHPHRINQW